jgi:hypothetical protein
MLRFYPETTASLSDDLTILPGSCGSTVRTWSSRRWCLPHRDAPQKGVTQTGHQAFPPCGLCTNRPRALSSDSRWAEVGVLSGDLRAVCRTSGLSRTTVRYEGRPHGTPFVLCRAHADAGGTPAADAGNALGAGCSTPRRRPSFYRFQFINYRASQRRRAHGRDGRRFHVRTDSSRRLFASRLDSPLPGLSRRKKGEPAAGGSPPSRYSTRSPHDRGAPSSSYRGPPPHRGPQ